MDSDLHEMSKPLTRGVDDEDRENHLKDVEHADDPMLQYMRKKRSKAEGKKKMDFKANRSHSFFFSKNLRLPFI